LVGTVFFHVLRHADFSVAARAGLLTEAAAFATAAALAYTLPRHDKHAGAALATGTRETAGTPA
jgi:hypothetical protein